MRKIKFQVLQFQLRIKKIKPLLKRFVKRKQNANIKQNRDKLRDTKHEDISAIFFRVSWPFHS